MLWLLAPRWLLLHALTVAAVAAAVLLGQWQMQSYAQQQQRDRAASAAAALTADPTPVDDLVPSGQPLLQASLGVLASADGEYDASATLLLPGRTLEGRTGYYVVTPLVDDAGVATPVLRGWVERPDAAAVQPPAGPVTVIGVVSATESEDDATVGPRESLPAGQVPALTTPVLFTSYPFPPADVRQALVVAARESPEPAPAPERVPVTLASSDTGVVSAWRHLSYASQWWLFAAAAIGFWVAFVRAGARERADGRPEPAVGR